MGMKEIRDKYRQPGGDFKRVLNKAIRAECPGGAEALAALTDARNLAILRGGIERPTKESALYLAVLRIVDAMEDEIRRRHGLAAMEPRGEPRRGRSIGDDGPGE